MLPKGNVENNVKRFSGFAKDYDHYRPAAPPVVVDILTTYLGQDPKLVADLGCGTGLSSLVWRDCAQQVVGVEPNDGMREQAEAKLQGSDAPKNISFVRGYSNQLEFAPDSVDVVTCSQSFHWMEPVSTLREVGRILRQGGVFAAYDCDWPPTVNAAVESAYRELLEQTDSMIDTYEETDALVTKWDKESHIARLAESKMFRFVKEIVFHNKEVCDAQRYVGFALTQGGLQRALRSGWPALDQLKATIERFQNTVDACFEGKEKAVFFSYRMRIGVK